MGEVITMTEAVLTEAERQRRAAHMADMREAVALGRSVEEHLQLRAAVASEWAEWFHIEMNECGVDDPTEVLPQALARIQQRATAEACRAAKDVARAEVQAHAIKEARRIAQEAARNEIRALLQKAIADGGRGS
jgi:hypothetical protein